MTSSSTARRGFLKLALGTAATSLTAPRAMAQAASKDPLFKISLAEWSLNKRMFKRKGAEPLDHLDFCLEAILRRIGCGRDMDILRPDAE